MILKKHFIFKISWTVINLALIILVSFFSEIGKVLLLSGILTNIFIIWEFRKIQPAIIMAVFFLSYLMYLIPYYFGDFLISGHDTYYKLELYNQVLGIHVLFLTAFYLVLNIKINSKHLLIRDLVKSYNNPFIFFVLYCLMCIILITIKGESVMDASGSSYETYMDNLDMQGGGLEYFYILFICAFYFTTNKIFRNSLLLLVAIYCYSCILRGYRIQLIQMIFLTFILFVDGKLKTFYIIALSFVGFLVSEILGLMKNIGSVSLEELVKLFDNSKGIIISNQTDVFYSSVAFIGLIKDGIYSLPVRIWSAIGFVVNWFIPSSFVWVEARVPQFAKQFTSLGGGGLISAYFYVWFGYLGPIAIGTALSVLFNSTYKSINKYSWKIMLILILSVFPRWFAYDPGNFFFRLPIYLILLYTIFRILHSSFSEKVVEN